MIEITEVEGKLEVRCFLCEEVLARLNRVDLDDFDYAHECYVKSEIQSQSIIVNSVDRE